MEHRHAGVLRAASMVARIAERQRDRRYLLLDAHVEELRRDVEQEHPQVDAERIRREIARLADLLSQILRALAVDAAKPAEPASF